MGDEKMKSVEEILSEDERNYLIGKMNSEESYLLEMLDETRSEYYDEAYRKILKESLERVVRIKEKLKIANE